MKQLLILSLMTLGGGIGALYTPFWGVLLYYSLAVLRPQYLWAWALPIEVRWSLAAALIAIISVVLHLHRVVTRGAVNLVLGLMLVHGVLLMFSVLTAYDPHIAEHWGIEYAKVLLLAVIASMVIERLWHVRLMGMMILAALGYIAWEINSLYFFQGGRLDIYHYGYGGLDNNGAGLMLAMGLPFAYVFAFEGGRWRGWRMLGCALLAGCIAHAIMMSYSRGAMLAATVGAVWLLVHHRPRWQAAGLAVAAVLAVSVLAGPQIRERFMSISNYQDDASAQSRFDSWQAAWQITWDDPLLGKGIRNSNLYSHNYGADRRGRTIHNQYLQIAADSGIPAAATYLMLMGVAVWNFGRARRWCLNYLDDRQDGDTPRLGEADAAEVELATMQRLCLAAQTSLITFGFGAAFLSLELFELPWLLFVLAGVLPGIVSRRIAELEDPDEPCDAAPVALPRGVQPGMTGA